MFHVVLILLFLPPIAIAVMLAIDWLSRWLAIGMQWAIDLWHWPARRLYERRRRAWEALQPHSGDCPYRGKGGK